MKGQVVPDRLAFSSLDDWRAWQSRQQPAVRRRWRQFRYRGANEVSPSTLMMWNPGSPKGSLLFALDSSSPSHHAAIVEPLKLLIIEGISVALIGQPPPDLPRGITKGSDEIADEIDRLGVRATVSIGGHLPYGDYVEGLARKHRLPHFVVQHGALTPFSPPPSDGDIVLAWSEEDAQMWTAGRSGVDAIVVGSQMLWQAAGRRTTPGALNGDSTDKGIVFLGQLHGAELPRRATFETVRHLQQDSPLTYRPHPAETDLLSRLQHRRLRLSGVQVDHASSSIAELTKTIVSQFSTGLLEATASGLPAFGFCVDAPTWLSAFWERYDIAPWGSSARPRTVERGAEPARAVIAALDGKT